MTTKLVSTGVEFPDATTQTTSGLPLTGGTMTGDVSLGDNVKAKFGASDDLQIYHDGSNSYMGDFGTGDLYLRASTNLYIGNSGGTASFITAADGGAVNIYHNGSTKLATTSTGIDVTGTVTADIIKVDTSNGASWLGLEAGGVNKAIIGLEPGVGGGSANDLSIYNRSGNVLLWSNSAERMRIDSSGNVLVGTTSVLGSGKVSIKYASNTETGIAIQSTIESYNTAVQFLNTAGTQVGTINTGTSSTAYSTSSDYRLKENVVPMTGSIDRLKALKPSKFNFIADATTTVDGFLAHEAQSVVPECVHGTKDAMRDEEYEVTPAVATTYDEDGNELTPAVEAVMGTRSVPDYQGIDQSKLVPLLVASLQEAVTKIEALEARVTALEV